MGSLENWQHEMQSVFLYRVMVEVETDEPKRRLFSAMERAALEQAGTWLEKIREEGDGVPGAFQPSARGRLVAWLIRRLGPQRILPVLAAMKVRGISVYRSDGLPGSHPHPTLVEEVGGRHRGVESGGNLRAAVFGVNDGLVSNTSLILGVAGATGDPGIILMTGIAGLLAGSFSMAAGEYVSMRSQREMYEYQIGLEREELALYPDEEREELALIYQARGLPMEQARQISAEMFRNPEHALNALSREELGLNPQDLGSPVGAAASSFLAFGAGGMIPLLPFMGFSSTQAALPVAIGASMVGLFTVGAALSLFNGKSAVWGGIRMLLIGSLAGAVTYLIGTLLGINLS